MQEMTDCEIAVKEAKRCALLEILCYLKDLQPCFEIADIDASMRLYTDIHSEISNRIAKL